MGQEMNDVVWLNRDEFVKKVESESLSLRVLSNESIFSISGIDTQLANFDDQGIIMLSTRANRFDFEEFAVRKINGVWKFSLCSQDVEKIKYGRGATSEYSVGKS